MPDSKKYGRHLTQVVKDLRARPKSEQRAVAVRAAREQKAKAAGG